MAVVRYCKRDGMKYRVGLQFIGAFGLSDPARKSVLEQVRSRGAALHS
jgi:hypothetical protein